MALVKFGAPIDEVRGSIGGVTFSRNRSATFARARKKPRFPRTDPNATAITLLGQFSKLWATHLTNQQRIDWNDLAAILEFTNPLGQTYHTSGFAIYCRAQVLLATAPYPEASPSYLAQDLADRNFTLDYLGGTGIRATNFDGMGGSAVVYLLTWWSGPVSPSRYTWSGPWHLLRTDLLDNIVPAPWTIVADVDVTADRRYFFRFRRIMNNGRPSARNPAEVLVP